MTRDCPARFDEAARAGTPDEHRPETAPLLGMVLKGYPRLSETFISNEIKLMEDLGFRIQIISMRPPREKVCHASVQGIRARVLYLPEYLLQGLPEFLPANIALFLKRPARYLKGLGLLLRRFPHAPKKHTWLKHFLQAGYLLRQLEKNPDAGAVDHFHAHFAHTPCSVAMYAAVLSGVPFSFTAHAKDIYTQKPKPLALKLARARFCVTCTRYNQKHLRSLAPSGRDVHCVYHGIDLSLFTAPERPVEATPPYRILTVARFVSKKGLPRILEALKLLKDQGLEFTWTLVGTGPQEKHLLERIDKMGLGEQVMLTGAIPHEQVLEHYRVAHCFVLGCRISSDGDRDGIPNVLAESMAMGVPVVATDVSGIPELVQHEQTGLLVPDEALRRKGAEPMAAALRRALEDVELRARIIPAGIERVCEIFDNRKCIRELAEIYARHGLGPGDAPGHPGPEESGDAS